MSECDFVRKAEEIEVQSRHTWRIGSQKYHKTLEL